MIVSIGKTSSSVASRASLQVTRDSLGLPHQLQGDLTSPTMALLFFWCRGKGTI